MFAPNSKYRAKITPARRGNLKMCHSADDVDQTPAEKRASMTWAQRLKRVFDIDIETCRKCGGDVHIIPKALAPLAGQALASIEDPAVIQKILAHLDNTASFCTLQHCCRIAGLRQAYRWVYSTEEINSIMALIYCPYFGNGMADLVPGSRIGEKHSCIRPVFRSERTKLTSLRGISIERPV